MDFKRYREAIESNHKGSTSHVWGECEFKQLWPRWSILRTGEPFTPPTNSTGHTVVRGATLSGSFPAISHKACSRDTARHELLLTGSCRTEGQLASVDHELTPEGDCLPELHN